jgi:hypothetical protein
LDESCEAVLCPLQETFPSNKKDNKTVTEVEGIKFAKITMLQDA